MRKHVAFNIIRGSRHLTEVLENNLSIRVTLAFNFEEVRQTTTSQPDATLSSWAVSSSKMILSKMTYLMMGWCCGIALGNGELTH